MNPAAEATPLLTIERGGQTFGLPLSAIRDVFEPDGVAPVPLAPAHVLGLNNLRGQIVTLLSFGALLGLPRSEERIAVGVEFRGEPCALMVEDVGDVITVTPEQRAERPARLPVTLESALHAVYRLPDRLLLQLDVAALLARAELPSS
jgi:purine-binding chemotaxis protein CheW